MTKYSTSHETIPHTYRDGPYDSASADNSVGSATIRGAA
jgi:hypothetical protein